MREMPASEKQTSQPSSNTPSLTISISFLVMWLNTWTWSTLSCHITIGGARHRTSKTYLCRTGASRYEFLLLLDMTCHESMKQYLTKEAKWRYMYIHGKSSYYSNTNKILLNVKVCHHRVMNMVDIIDNHLFKKKQGSLIQCLKPYTEGK